MEITYGRDKEFHEDMNSIPYISFPVDWEIAIIPPFGGATARFRAKLKGKEECVSVYLDCHSRLGAMDEPYWEIYPSDKGDCERFYLNEVSELLDGISRSFKYIYETKGK